jgi:hypothetical protein
VRIGADSQNKAIRRKANDFNDSHFGRTKSGAIFGPNEPNHHLGPNEPKRPERNQTAFWQNEPNWDNSSNLRALHLSPQP